VESSQDAIIGENADGKIVSWNCGAEHLYGYTAEEVQNQPISILVPPDYTDEMRNIRNWARQGKGVVQYETVRLRKHGRRVDVALTASPIRNAAGELTGVATIAHDITQRKEAEGELRKAKEAAEAASRIKSEFLANMSHEIRTPMNAIIGMTELTLDSELDEEQREYLTTVRRAANSLLGLINQVLDFSKIDAKKLELETLQFRLRESLDETLRTLAVRAHEKGLELVADIRPGVPDAVLGDPGRLRQIVMNLVGNAIKFTERGEVVLRVETESQQEDHVYLHFTVQDTGIGIPWEKQQLIFEAFTQADGSLTRRYGGTGLGLTISSQLIGQMGGRIWVVSEVGEGSTFHFTIRLSRPKEEEPHTPAEALSLTGVPVLVVDDNATNRRILEEVLSRWGMRPVLADGVASALDFLERAKEAGKPFPLVLTDLQMPEMDGSILAEKIKQNPDLAGSTIMMLRSGRRRGDAARFRELGVGAYLTKPIQQTELLKGILSVLPRERETNARGQPLIPHWSLEQRPVSSNLRVLVAEDSADNRTLLVRLLQKRGHQVVAVENGREALDVLEQTGRDQFDLILMDVQMPEMTGVEATAAIRKKERSAGGHLPIIAVTAHALATDREKCLDAGMDGYVAKPIQARELFAVIERLAAHRAEPVTAPRA
jgi:two-component system, sensor histidine kinase and response regulator